MKIASKDRVKVRSECMRLLRTLKLDPARAQMIGGFIENYLKLNAAEMKQYQREFATQETEEQEKTMQMWTSWGQAGLKQGKEELIALLVNRLFGSVPEQVSERLEQLSTEQLDELGVALIDFKSAADLENWLSRAVQPN